MSGDSAEKFPASRSEVGSKRARCLAAADAWAPGEAAWEASRVRVAAPLCGAGARRLSAREAAAAAKAEERRELLERAAVAKEAAAAADEAKYQAWLAEFAPRHVRVRELVVDVAGDKPYPYSLTKLRDRFSAHRGHVSRWLADPGVPVWDSIELLPPGAPPSPGAYNTWKGFAAAALPPAADAHRAEWDWLRRELLRDVLCAGDAACGDYLEGWMAHIFQSPGARQQVPAVVANGAQGSGKTTGAVLLQALLGPALWSQTDKAEHVAGAFARPQWDGKLLVCLDETTGRGGGMSSAHAEALKNLTMAGETDLAAKGKDQARVRLYGRLWYTSNAAVPVPITDPRERHYLVLRVSDKRVGDAAFWDRAHAAIASDGVRRAALDWFLARDLAAWSPTGHPRTAALLDLVKASRNQVQRFLDQGLLAGTFLAEPTAPADLYRAYRMFCEDQGVRFAVDAPTEDAFLLILKSAGLDAHAQLLGGRWQSDVDRLNGWRAARGLETAAPPPAKRSRPAGGYDDEDLW
jgi:hypothetical protein